MIRNMRPRFELPMAAITFILVLGALSMIWPGIMVLGVSVFLLLQSCGPELEVGVSSWAEINHMSIAFAVLRRFGLSTILPP